MAIQKAVLGIGISVLVVVGLWTYDRVMLGASNLPNKGPDFSTYGVVKIGITAVLSLLIVASIAGDGRDRLRNRLPPSPVPVALVILSYALAIGFVTLYLVDPVAFHRQSLEDSPVEWASALLCLGGAALYAHIFIAARRSRSRERRRAMIIALPCAFVLFLIGMEELSWMQRVADVETPAAFAENKQGEMNLHNFVTKPAHFLYRLASWMSLILLPFFLRFGGELPVLRFLDGFLPDHRIAALSVPLAGFFYNAWPFLPSQVIFFSSVVVMLFWALDARRLGYTGEAGLFALGALIVAGSQSVFLFGEHAFRLWDVTEYQELFIALGLAALAWFSRRRWIALLEEQEARVGPDAQSVATPVAQPRLFSFRSR